MLMALKSKDVNGTRFFPFPSQEKISHSRETNFRMGEFREIEHNPSQQNSVTLKSRNSV